MPVQFGKITVATIQGFRNKTLAHATWRGTLIGFRNRILRPIVVDRTVTVPPDVFAAAQTLFGELNHRMAELPKIRPTRLAPTREATPVISRRPFEVFPGTDAETGAFEIEPPVIPTLDSPRLPGDNSDMFIVEFIPPRGEGKFPPVGTRRQPPRLVTPPPAPVVEPVEAWNEIDLAGLECSPAEGLMDALSARINPWIMAFPLLIQRPLLFLSTRLFKLVVHLANRAETAETGKRAAEQRAVRLEEAQLRSLIGEIPDEIGDQYTSLTTRFDELTREIAFFNSRIEGLTGNKGFVEGDLGTERQNQKTAESRRRTLERDINVREGRIAELIRLRGTLETTMANLANNIEEDLNHYSGTNPAIVRIKDRILHLGKNESGMRVRQLERALELLTEDTNEQISTINAQLRELDLEVDAQDDQLEERDQLTLTLSQLDTAIGALNGRLQQLNQQILSVTGSRAERAGEKEQIASRLQSLGRSVVTARQKTLAALTLQQGMIDGVAQRVPGFTPTTLPANLKAEMATARAAVPVADHAGRIHELEAHIEQYRRILTNLTSPVISGNSIAIVLNGTRYRVGETAFGGTVTSLFEHDGQHYAGISFDFAIASPREIAAQIDERTKDLLTKLSAARREIEQTRSSSLNNLAVDELVLITSRRGQGTVLGHQQIAQSNFLNCLSPEKAAEVILKWDNVAFYLHGWNNLSPAVQHLVLPRIDELLQNILAPMAGTSDRDPLSQRILIDEFGFSAGMTATNAKRHYHETLHRLHPDRGAINTEPLKKLIGAWRSACGLFTS
ncbi:MAG: hypothetical protein WC890_07780 [Candidatus Margulisiibacteriota bacterium]